MSDKNARRKEQLGMPYGTASNKLKKMILFKLLVHVGAHNCFVCGDEIGSVEELSIEHIEPWEGRPDGVEKFWDLDNIAFSHVGCNRPHNYRNGNPRNEAPEGMAWCSIGKHYDVLDNFHKHAKRWNGVQSKCKQHHRK